MTVHIEPSAIVDNGALIGNGTKIWHFSHICSSATIGCHCSVGQNVFIADNVVIGNNVKIQNNVSVYDGVVLEDGVFCGPSAVFTNVYNPRSAINRKSEFRKTIVKHGASLGANCTIVCGITIGRYAFIGAGAVINKNIIDYALVVGVPGVQIGWISEHGENLSLPLVGSGKSTCPSSGECYTLTNGKVVKNP